MSRTAKANIDKTATDKSQQKDEYKERDISDNSKRENLTSAISQGITGRPAAKATGKDKRKRSEKINNNEEFDPGSG